MSRNAHPEITEQRILQAATRLFLENGWERITIQDIVDDLGDLTRGAFYHHFKSKEDLIDAVLQKLSAENNPFQAAKAISGLNGLEKLKKALLLSISRGEQLDAMQEIPSILASPQLVFNQMKQCVAVGAPYIQALIEAGNGDGSLSVLYPKQTAESFMLLTNLWLSPIIFAVDEAEYEQKLLHLQGMYGGIGLPVLDEALIVTLKKMHRSIGAAH